jgi:asparagine synthase (glutamine-hydrolysing)
MSNEDGSVWITFNGEIYNHENLRAGLISRGHRYRSRSDTETIVHSYEEHGLGFVEHLDGDFAIGLWDANEKRLVLARDRLGVKPLYYAIVGGKLIFASEIKAILSHPSVPRELDEEALYHYVTFLAAPAPSTLFAGIHKLPAGCLLTCSARGEINVSRYWDAVVKNPDPEVVRDESAAASRVLSLLEKSIEKRMMSDVPFGVFLSGGIDSTANVALMARMVKKPIRTFTVGFREDPAFSEIHEARRVAALFHTDHHEIEIGEQELLDFIPELIYHQDEPIADPVCVPVYFVSRLAQQSGTKVIQVGEGSDELFCGYRDYASYLRFNDYIWRHLQKLPAGARRAAARLGQTMIAVGGEDLPSTVVKHGADLLRRLAADEELFWSGAFVFDETTKQSLFSKSFKGRRAGLSSREVVVADLTRLLEARSGADLLERMTYQELKLRLPELLLMRVDKMTMAASVEARVPFLDHELVELAVSIPRSLKYRRGVTKYILKRALDGVIPDDVIYRQKVGFGVPINRWMLGPLERFVREAFGRSALRRRDILDFDYVERLLEMHRRGRVDYSFRIWSLLNLVLWYDRWIDRCPHATAKIADYTAKPESSERASVGV